MTRYALGCVQLQISEQEGVRDMTSAKHSDHSTHPKQNIRTSGQNSKSDLPKEGVENSIYKKEAAKADKQRRGDAADAIVHEKSLEPPPRHKA